MSTASDEPAFVPEAAQSPAFRQIAHDLRSILAAALANAEYLRDLQTEDEARDAANETVHELRLAADVLALLGALSLSRLSQIDLRAVLWLSQRSGAPLRIDPTGPAVEVRAEIDVLRAFASAIASVAGDMPLKIHSDTEGLLLHAVDPPRVDQLRAALKSVPLPAELRVRGDGTVVVCLGR